VPVRYYDHLMKSTTDRSAVTDLSRKILLVGLYLTLLTPLVVWHKSVCPPFSGKVLLFQVLVEVLIICWVVTSGRKKTDAFRLAPTFLAAAGFIGVNLISAVAGVDLKQSLWGFIERQDGLVLILHFFAWMALSYWYFGSEKNVAPSIQRFLGFSFGVAVAVATSVLWEGYVNLPPDSSLVSMVSGLFRPGGVFGNPMATGPYLAFHLFFGLYLGNVVRKLQNRNSRLIFLLLLVAGELVIIAAVAVGQTRGVIFGILGGVLSCAVMALVSRSAPRALRYSSAAIAGAALCAVAVLWLARESSFVKANQLLWRVTHLSSETVSTRARLITWQSGLSSFKDHPLLGWGPRNVYYGMNKYYDPGLVQFSRGFQDRPETWFDKSHNAYIDLAAETGVLGLAAFVVLIVILSRVLWRMPNRFLSISIAGALIGYALSNLTGFDSFGSLLGLFLSLTIVSIFETPVELPWFQSNRKTRQKGGRAKRPASNHSPAWITAGVCLLLIAALGLYSSIEIAVADHKCFLAKYAFLRDASEGIALYEDAFSHFSPYNAREKVLCAYLIVHAAVTGTPSSQSFDAGKLVVEYANDALNARPDDSDVFVKLNEIYNSMALHIHKGFADRAEYFGKRATELSPSRQEAAFTLARTYLIKGEPARAIELNSRVVANFPEFSTGHWFLGLSYLAAGDRDSAKREIRTALRMGYQFQNANESDAVKELFGKAGYEDLIAGR
jgi:O-antigen ligase